MEKVAVIMSTYNGEKYIRQQLDSIVAQSGVEPYIFIRDDGSSDDTLKIISEYEIMYKNISLTNKSYKKNIGVKESFFSLLEYVLIEHKGIQYFSFSDQDDFWNENKLYEALVKRTDNELWLYFSNKTAVDEELNLLYQEHLAYYNDILEIFWGSQAYGCTMVFSRRLAEVVVSNRNKIHEINLLHDSLMYRVAHIIGSDICFDQESYIKYRQHQFNVIGIKYSKKMSGDWKRLLHRSPHFISKLSLQLADNYSESLSEEGKYYLDLVCQYRKSIIARCTLIFDKKAIARGLKLYLIWVGKIVLRRL